MHRTGALRRLVAALAMVVPLLAVSPPALASDADFTKVRDAWAQNRTNLDEATSGLEALDAEEAKATAAYEAVVARLEGAQQRLDRLREELDKARSRQRIADRDNDVAIRRLGQATMVLVATEDALAEYAALLDIEIVAAYKHAGTSAQFRGVVDALVRSGSVTEFTNAYAGLRNGTAEQQRLVEGVTALADRLDDQRVIVATLAERTADAERIAVSRRRHVARLTAEQQSVVAGVRADRVERQRLVAQLRSKQAQFVKRVETLQKESDALLAQLRKYRYVGGAPGTKDMWWPTDGGVTSNFGYRVHPIFKVKRLHAGIDIPGPTGQPIFAAAPGRIVRAGLYGGYGNVVVIDHGEGLSTVYAHQLKVAVAAGDEVEAGDTIGYVGSSGFSTGPHLHFEVRTGGTPVDPLEWY